jgi:RimJ/RimL family protein N-acetyltransferase
VKTPIDPEIAPLSPPEAGELSAILKASSPEYIAHFNPFAFDEETVRTQLLRARRDRFWGLRVGGKLAGFFMLRGFDEGYERPAFGVFIAEQFAGRGLARTALAEATKWCTENGVQEMMLTVYRENVAAVRVYEEAGFVATDPGAAKFIMTKRLTA